MSAHFQWAASPSEKAGLLLSALLIGLVNLGSRGLDTAARRTAFGMMGLGVGTTILFVLVGLFLFASEVLVLVGQGLCMQVPNRKSGAMRILAIVALGCGAAAIVLNLANYFVLHFRSVGTLCALLAIVPAFSGRGGILPIVSMGSLLLAVLTAGVASSLLATAIALRSPLLSALRSE